MCDSVVLPIGQHLCRSSCTGCSSGGEHASAGSRILAFQYGSGHDRVSSMFSILLRKVDNQTVGYNNWAATSLLSVFYENYYQYHCPCQCMFENDRMPG
jgi:3-hydroxy-3-methylglutaryl CoA synthase